MKTFKYPILNSYCGNLYVFRVGVSIVTMVFRSLIASVSSSVYFVFELRVIHFQVQGVSVSNAQIFEY